MLDFIFVQEKSLFVFDITVENFEFSAVESNIYFQEMTVKINRGQEDIVRAKQPRLTSCA